jgi:hypothetical protein
MNLQNVLISNVWSSDPSPCIFFHLHHHEFITVLVNNWSNPSAIMACFDLSWRKSTAEFQQI